MTDLVIRPSGRPAPKEWSLQLRRHDSLGPTQYETLCHLSREQADEVVGAERVSWLLGEPEKRERMTARRFMQIAADLYWDRPDDFRLSLGWRDHSLPADYPARFFGDISLTVGEVRAMAREEPDDAEMRARLR